METQVYLYPDEIWEYFMEMNNAGYDEEAYEYEEFEDDGIDFEDDRAERIVEIYDAFYDLLNVLLDDHPIDSMIDELSEVVGKWLYKHNISIYHPMKLEDNKGNSEWVDFPYPEIT